jgi:hypothetical protein
MTANDWANVHNCAWQREQEAKFYGERDVERREYFAQRRIAAKVRTMRQRNAQAVALRGDAIPCY